MKYNEIMSNETKRTLIAEMRKRPALLESNGDYWSEEDTNKICGLYDEGWGITDLALELGRTENAIWLRLTLLGKLQKSCQHKTRTKTVTCKCGTCELREACDRYNSIENVPEGMFICFSETN